jgi:hypothetical protein
MSAVPALDLFTQPGSARALEHQLDEGDVAHRVGLHVRRQHGGDRPRPAGHVNVARGKLQHEPLEPSHLLARRQQERLLQQVLFGLEPVRRRGERYAGPLSDRAMRNGVRAARPDQGERGSQDRLASGLSPWYIRSDDAYKCTDEDGQRRHQL